MQADPAVQRQLLDLATLDTQIAQLGHKKRTLPEIGELTALRGRHQSISEDLVAAETKLSDAELAMQRIESDLGPARERLARNQKRVDDGAISDAKALRGMLEEIEHLKGRISNLEDQELEQMQVVEDLTADRDRLTGERNEITAQARELIGRRDEKASVIDAQLATTTDSRALLAGRLPSDLIGLYDKIGARVGGPGAAELRARRCSGCGLEANAADLRRYAAAAAEEIVRCEECGRILVRTGESGF